jgi:hypothetical protein
MYVFMCVIYNNIGGLPSNIFDDTLHFCILTFIRVIENEKTEKNKIWRGPAVVRVQ